MIIRKETAADAEAIDAVTRAAFKIHSYSRQTEQFIIAALRAAGALTLSLVAELEGTVVGHIAFSPVTLSGNSCGWYGMGTALVQEGLNILREMGAKGCALVGDPHFYERFGFCNMPELRLEGVPQELFRALPFGNNIAQGVMAFHEGFQATS